MPKRVGNAVERKSFWSFSGLVVKLGDRVQGRYQVVHYIEAIMGVHQVVFQVHWLAPALVAVIVFLV